jgi:hypothetical protein
MAKAKPKLTPEEDTTMSPYAKEFTAAAQWWGEQLKGLPGRNNGASAQDDPTGFGTAITLLAAASTPTADDVQIGRFVDALVKHLCEQAGERLVAGRRVHFSIGTDYHPDRELADAASAAGIDCYRFPWKTMMWIDPGFVRVSAGYQAEEEVIWPRDFYRTMADEFERFVPESDRGGHLSVGRKDDEPSTFQCTYRDRIASVSFDILALPVERGDKGAAMTAGADLAAQWGRRTKRQCNERHGNYRCYDGEYFSVAAKTNLKCEACGGRGYFETDNVDVAVTSRVTAAAKGRGK